MNATRSFVPTPSALATSTGSRSPRGASAEEAAERADVGEHARRERAARERADAADDLVAGVDVDAGLPCNPSESDGESSLLELQLLDERVGDLARRASLPAPAQ